MDESTLYPYVSLSIVDPVCLVPDQLISPCFFGFHLNTLSELHSVLTDEYGPSNGQGVHKRGEESGGPRDLAYEPSWPAQSETQ